MSLDPGSSSSQDVLRAGRDQYVTILVTTFAFGIYVVVVGLSLHYLLRDARGNPSRGRLFVLGYTWSMLLITCAWYYCVARHFDEILVEHAHDELGIKGQQFWVPKNYAQNIFAAIQFLSCDGLLVYRVYVVCNRRWQFVVLPLTIYVAYFGVTIMVNLAGLSVDLGGSLHLPPIMQTATALWVLGATQNLICMAIIVFRMLTISSSHASVSITAISILAESAALLTVCSFTFTILTRTGSPAQSWFGAVANCAAFLSQAWIILRVALRQAYTGGYVQTIALRPDFTTNLQLPSRVSFQTSTFDPRDGTTLGEDSDDRKSSNPEVPPPVQHVV